VRARFVTLEKRALLTLPEAGRPNLAQALLRCRQMKATLRVATLDRLSRNVAFFLTRRDSGVNFQALDIPKKKRPSPLWPPWRMSLAPLLAGRAAIR
jgi:hypothetical protein